MFIRQLKKLSKQYRKIKSDLDECIPDIEADYSSACAGARIPKRRLNFEMWKYSFGSSDLKRSPNRSFRAIGVFLEEEAAGKIRTLYLILCYFKGDQEEASTDELADAIAKLRDELNQAQEA